MKIPTNESEIMQNRLYPVVPVEKHSKENLDRLYPMRVVKFDTMRSKIVCEIERIEWRCDIDISMYFRYRKLYDELIRTRSLYAIVDVNESTANWATLSRSPQKQDAMRGRFIEFGVAIPNYSFTTRQKVLVYQKNLRTNEGSHLAPVVAVHRPLRRDQPDDRLDISYQLLLPNSVVACSQPTNLTKHSRIEFPFLNGVEIKTPVDWLRYHSPLVDMLEWFDLNSSIQTQVTNIDKAVNLMWVDMSSHPDYEPGEISEIKGTRKDPREWFDTPNSIANRFLYNFYQCPVDTDKIRSLRTRVTRPRDLANFLANKTKRVDRETWTLLTYSNEGNRWLQYPDVRNDRVRNHMQSNTFWCTPYIITMRKDTNRDQSDVELVFPDVSQLDLNNVIDRAGLTGHEHFGNERLNHPDIVHTRALDNVFLSQIPQGLVYTHLEHEGSLYRGVKHILTYVSWTNQWFYHGWFRDRDPYTNELYQNACRLISNHITYMFPDRSIEYRVFDSNQQTDIEIPKIPEHYKRPISWKFVPVFEIRSEKDQKKKRYKK